MSTTSPLTATRISFLHGDLDIQIVQARHLPNMDLLSERFRRVASVFGCSSAFSKPRTSLHENVQNHLNSRRHHHHENIITSDPYVTVCLAGAIVARTRVISNTTRPVWNEHFNVPLAHPVSCVDFLVKDNDVFGADWIGTASVPAQQIATGETIDDWFALIGANGKQPKVGCSIHVKMKFIPCDKTDRYRSSITGGSSRTSYGVDRSYFPVRHGGAVTLYQDAHVMDHVLPPPVELEVGMAFKREKCWEDICHAILEAHHMVYIVGWSIYDKVKLVREPTKPLPDAGKLSLGELLKNKSQEGVRVLLLLWDDKTSHSSFFINTKGVMQTHDEETKKFFKHSSVICVLSPRYASSKLSIFKQQVVGTLYTHHQKCVIVDSQASGNNRKLTAFLGGLDLCDGRYDTTEHRLLRDLNTTFKNDFHNPSLPAGTMGPRQPWHDLHCKIEGPAAYDVLTNFEQRWRKASKWSQLGKRVQRIAHWKDDALLKIGRISWFLSPNSSIPSDDPKLWVREENDPENWNVQIFRSIDSGSVKGFPKDAQKAEDQNLVCAKHLTIDRSIQTAYVEAIRSAQHFIYIENQYFIGSSYAWHTYKNAGADNLIPMELALKIASKIRAQQRFVVYVVIPMWPEGNPSSASVQEILFWQRETMQMMYGIIATELKPENFHEVNLQDYLNFYCLGNREPPEDQGSTPSQHHSCGGESVSASQRFRRFMIYVHAKGMIVDDEYVILGSANINQRSMAGSRDTEIAMGAYQPHHTWAIRKAHPRGQVYGYRMSLWAEHLGEVDESYVEAESLDCVREVNRIAKDNWAKFVDDSYIPLQGHLLKYPVEVDNNGKISALPGHDQFPDVGGKILGAPTASLPDALTT